MATKRKLVTVDDILTKDEVNEIMESAFKVRKEIKDMVFVWIDRDGNTHTAYFGVKSSILWGLEQAKLELLGVLEREEDE